MSVAVNERILRDTRRLRKCYIVEEVCCLNGLKGFGGLAILTTAAHVNC